MAAVSPALFGLSGSAQIGALLVLA